MPWIWFVVKWPLVALGAYLVLMLAFEEIAEGRFGLGTGFAAALIVATIKGILMAVTGPPPPPRRTDLKSR